MASKGPIPVPSAGNALGWSLHNPTAPTGAVRGLNKLLTLRVVVAKSGGSSLLIGDEEAVLTISTKDINLGSVTGSKGGNAALSSLMTVLGQTFTISDSTS